MQTRVSLIYFVNVCSHKSRTLVQFSQTGAHFIQNHELNPIKLTNVKKYLDLGVWDGNIIYSMMSIPCKNNRIE